MLASRQEEACHLSAERVQDCKLCRHLAENTTNESDTGAVDISTGRAGKEMASHHYVRLTIHSKELQQIVLFCAAKAVWQTANPDFVET